MARVYLRDADSKPKRDPLLRDTLSSNQREDTEKGKYLPCTSRTLWGNQNLWRVYHLPGRQDPLNPLFGKRDQGILLFWGYSLLLWRRVPGSRLGEGGAEEEGGGGLWGRPCTHHAGLQILQNKIDLLCHFGRTAPCRGIKKQETERKTLGTTFTSMYENVSSFVVTYKHHILILKTKDGEKML